MIDPSARTEIHGVLTHLRARIQRYLVLEGVAAVVALLGGLFWFSYAADVTWFQISKLELPLWFRRSLTVIAAALCCGAVATWLGLRLWRRFQGRALALVLERRFPELDDRLVTAVELADSPRATEDPLSAAMLARTVADAARTVERLDLDRVFDARPLRRSVLAAVVLAASIFGLGVANADGLRRWYDAYIAGTENYWDPYRQSEMTVQIVAQPGDRVRDFVEGYHYKHPRGADLTVLVTVAEGKRVPETVTLRHRSSGAGGASRGAVGMSRVGERQFRHTLGRVIEPHELWIVGGDFTNRAPYTIEIVDPPKVDRIELRPTYPDYLGWQDRNGVPVMVQGARVPLPMETEFLLQARANKPLTGVQLRSERFQLSISLPASHPEAVGECSLTIAPADGAASRRFSLAPDVARQLLPGDRKTFTLPMQVSLKAENVLAALLEAAGEGQAVRELPQPFPLPPDLQMQLYLEDDDEILSFEPATFVINAIPDAPPMLDVQLTGIGNRITRLATIPLKGKLTDDYGLADVWFGYQIGGQEGELTAPLVNPPAGRLSFELMRSEREKVERFDVLPLKLEPGRQLTLALYARDGDVLNGPHESHTPYFNFEIVSEDALLGDLYQKEMNLRLRFEHIREEVESVRTDLLLHRGRFTEGVKLQAAPPAGRTAEQVAEELRQIGIAVQACAQRSLHLIRKNHAETREVEMRFRDIREELVNNRVDTPAALTRLDQGIVLPLAAINETGYPSIDEPLGLFALALEREQDPTAPIDEAVLALDRVIAQMDRILEQMQQRKGFNEVILELQALLDRQRKVLDATEQERQRSVIEDLFK